MHYLFASMDINQEIKQLLSFQWNYHRGLEIFKAHGNNDSLVRLISRDPDSAFFNKKLKQELSKLKIEPKKAQIKIQIDSSKVRIEDYDPKIQPFIQKKNSFVKEQNHLQARLLDLPKDDRKQAAFRILELDVIIADYWRQIDYFEEHKDFIPSLEEDEVNRIFQGLGILDTSKVLNNYRTYLTKAKKKNRSTEKVHFYKAVIAEAERRLSHE